MLRKSIYSTILALAMVMTGCGTQGLDLLGNVLGGGTTGTSTTTTNTGTGAVLGNVLGSVLSGVANANTANGLLDMVIGNVKLDQSSLVGTWVYSEPGCAFTSENLLAKAGGSVAATQVKQKLNTAYSQLGISNSNTYFVFNQDNTFEAKIKGIPMSGSYTFDSSSSKLTLKTLLLSTPAYVTRTTNGLSITMESKKLLTVLQTLTSVTGNSTLSAVGDLSKNFNGVRLGFDVVRK